MWLTRQGSTDWGYLVVDGGQSAAWGLRYQYLRTLEALMDAVEEPGRGVVAVHVEGLPGDDGKGRESIDYELTDADGRFVVSAQVKARAAGTGIGAGQAFRALAGLVLARDAARYVLLTTAGAGPSAKALVQVLRSGLAPQELRTALGELLKSVSAAEQQKVLGVLKDEHLIRLGRAEVLFDPRDDDEVTDQLRSRLRWYRNQANAGLGDQSAGLLIDHLIAEIFRRAANPADATFQVARFREHALAGADTVAGALGKRDWGVMIGDPPGVPTVRRAGLLGQIQAALPVKAQGNAVPICRVTGLSGIGKSSLAFGYVLDRADIYDVIFWANAESEQTLAASFARAFRRLHGSGPVVPDDPELLREHVLSALSASAGRWLLVLDNCADLRSTEKWIPKSGHGHVIVTTTDSASPPGASTPVPVGGMEVAQAVQLLSADLNLDPSPDGPLLKLLVRLARKLECWPLALKLACAYLYPGPDLSHDILDYLRALQKIGSFGNPELVPFDYPRTLIQAIYLCLERIGDLITCEDQGISGPARIALAALRASAYLSSRQVPVYLALSVPLIGPGDDAFRGDLPVIIRSEDLAPIEVLRILHKQSLVERSEPLPAEGITNEDERRYLQTISVNAVIQEVMQYIFDEDGATAEIIDRLAWHTERWLRFAVDYTAHDRALILAAHAEAIEGHASRLGLNSDFIALLRGNLATVQIRQNKRDEVLRLLRLETEHFRGRSEEHARLLNFQASTQLASVLAANLAEEGTGTSDGIADLLEPAYFYLRELAAQHPEGAAHHAATILSLLNDLRRNNIRPSRLERLRAAVTDLTERLPDAPLSAAIRTLGKIEDHMDEGRDVKQATDLARTLLDEVLAGANTHEGTQLRCHARKMLIETLAARGEFATAITEFDNFIAEAQPPSIYVREIEYLIHNVGQACAAESVLSRRPSASDLLSRLLADGRAELVEHRFPGNGGPRMRLLRGVEAFRSGDLDRAADRASGYLAATSGAAGSGRSFGWDRLAKILRDAVEIETDKSAGFTRPSPWAHEFRGRARYLLLPRHARQWVRNCPPKYLPLMAVLAISRELGSLTGGGVPACQQLAGALNHLGCRSEMIPVSARVEHGETGQVQWVGSDDRGIPVLGDNGLINGHAVLWEDSHRIMIDPAIMQLQQLHPVTADPALNVPIILSVPSRELFLSPGTGLYPAYRRHPLEIGWFPDIHWGQALTPAPGTGPDTALRYGALALAHAALELLLELHVSRDDLSEPELASRYPQLSALLDGRASLPVLPDEPPIDFLHACSITDPVSPGAVAA